MRYPALNTYLPWPIPPTRISPEWATGYGENRLRTFEPDRVRISSPTPRCVGGVADHVHLLLSLPTTVPIAKAIQLIKAGSSAWIHQTFRQLDNFSWQQGYGAFSVSVSQLPETIHYIQNQVEHHRTRTFQQEYLVSCPRNTRYIVAIKMGRRQGVRREHI